MIEKSQSSTALTYEDAIAILGQIGVFTSDFLFRRTYNGLIRRIKHRRHRIDLLAAGSQREGLDQASRPSLGRGSRARAETRPTLGDWNGDSVAGHHHQGTGLG